MIRPIILMLVLGLSVFAQSNLVHYQMVSKGKDQSFPVFFNSSNQRAISRVNSFLQLIELERLVHKPSGKVFDRVSMDDGSIYGKKKYMEATVFSNDHRLISVGFVESSCGATCAYWHSYYNFNPGNGDRIELKDLFTPDGFEQLSERIVSKRSAIYRREVLKKVSADEQEGFLGVLGSIENDNLSDFYIYDRSIFIDGENSLLKGLKFEGLNMYVRFDLSEFKPFLNEYGMSVFGFSNADISKFRSRDLPQLFEGKIDGSIPIRIVINEGYETGEIRGIYAYPKYGLGIYLKGNLQNEQLTLTETVLSNETRMMPYGPKRDYIENGYITATFDGKSIEGDWTDKDKTQTLTISASIE